MGAGKCSHWIGYKKAGMRDLLLEIFRLVKGGGQLNRFCSILLLSVVIGYSAGCVTEVTNPLGEVDEEQATAVSIKAGIQYLKAGNFDRAHHHLTKALSFSPKSSEAHSAIALLYQRTGDPKLEEKHYRKAVRYDSKASAARNNYGGFLFRVGRYKEALKQLTKAAEDPSYDKRDLAYINIGRCALKLDDNELAESAFLKALRLNSSLPRPYLELADIYFGQDKIKEASGYIKKYGSVARHSARSLWLGIRIARITNDKNALASHALALRNLYPDSKEYDLYKSSASSSDSASPAPIR